VLVAGIAGPAAAGVSPLSIVKKQLRSTTKIAKTADHRAKAADKRAQAADAHATTALQGPVVIADQKDVTVPLATGSYAAAASVSLPKGRWVLEGGLQVNNNTGTPGARDDYRLASGASTLIERSAGIGSSNSGDYSSVISVATVLNTSSPTTIALECRISAASGAVVAQTASSPIATRAR
jgi:hypothetical protein